MLVIDSRGQQKRYVSRKRFPSKWHPSHYGECMTLSWLHLSTRHCAILTPHILFRVSLDPAIFSFYFLAMNMRQRPRAADLYSMLEDPWAAVFHSEEETLPGPPSSYRFCAVNQQQPAHTLPNLPYGWCLVWIPWGCPICIICPVFFDMVKVQVIESREEGLRNTVTHLKLWEG